MIYFFRILCIDATHGTNKYDYKLVTLLVKDETDRGIPVAHCICTHENTDILTVFFKELCKKSGPVVVDYILTDDAVQVNIVNIIDKYLGLVI